MSENLPKTTDLNLHFYEILIKVQAEEREKIIQVYQNQQQQNHEIQLIKEENHQKTRSQSMIFGLILGTFAFVTTGTAILQKSNLMELAAVMTPIAALAGVFLWGFQRKD